MAMADALIADTIYQKNYPEGVTYNWFHRFMKLAKRNGLTLAAPNPSEESRKQWCTAKNARTHYTVLHDVLLKSGMYSCSF